jgi:hypothetical protein
MMRSGFSLASFLSALHWWLANQTKHFPEHAALRPCGCQTQKSLNLLRRQWFFRPGCAFGVLAPDGFDQWMTAEFPDGTPLDASDRPLREVHQHGNFPLRQSQR